jgi:hypothetical protein
MSTLLSTHEDSAASEQESVLLGLPENDAADPIGSLERLLTVERKFLTALDSQGVDAVAERKLQLIQALEGTRLDDVDLERLRGVRELAINNQLLTAHARDTVASIIAATTGATSRASYHPLSVPRPGTRLSVKG